MSNIFGELDHRMSVVKRWGILHTIQTQSVAEHVFNVERIAIHIAQEWFGLYKTDDLWRIYEAAHYHDDEEALTGDLPAMMKPYFDEKTFKLDHGDLIKQRVVDPQIRKIVKLADKLEGYHFLCIENQLGNAYSMNHLEAEWPIIIALVEEYWPGITPLHNKVQDCMSAMLGEKSIRHSKRGK